MRKLAAFILFLAIAPFAAAQTQISGSAVQIGGTAIPQYTVAGLPSASANHNMIAEVTDGANGSDCSVGSGTNNVICISNGTSWISVRGLSGMTAGQVPIAATATTVTSSKAVQGTDANLLSSGTVSGTGAALCTDANGGATTSGCPAAGAFAGGLGTSYQDVTEIAAPANPAAGNDRLYLSSSTHQLSCLTSSGGSCMPAGSGIALQNAGTPLGTITTLNCSTGTTCSVASGTGTITSTGGAGGNVYETRKLNTVAVENVACAGGSTCTIASITGQGTMTHLQFAQLGGNGAATNDGLIKITVDGTLVLSAPTGLVFGTYLNGAASGTTAQYFTSPREALTFVDATNFQGQVNWIIPYNTSLLVQWANTGSGATSGSIYSNVDYYSGAPPAGLYPSQMGSFHSVYTAFTSVAQYGTFTMLPTVTAAGMLGSIQLAAYSSSVTTPTWLEGDPTITIDGTAYTYTGTEDFFCGSFYFNGVKGNIMGSCGSAYVGTYSAGYGTSMYRFFYPDPGTRMIPFTTSLTITTPNGQSGQSNPAPGSVNYASLVTYYTNP